MFPVTLTVISYGLRILTYLYEERKLNISIDTPTLIDLAKRKSGMRLQDMADEMHISQPRISEWKSQKKGAEPSADQIAYLASKAGLPIIETLIALRPQWAHVWERAMRTGLCALPQIKPQHGHSRTRRPPRYQALGSRRVNTKLTSNCRVGVSASSIKSTHLLDSLR